MNTRPGSVWWLLRHEMRLNWRSVGGKSLWFIGIAGGLLWIALHLAAWISLGRLGSLDFVELPVLTRLVSGGLFWVLATLLIGQTLYHAVIALFDRGDLDLLLSSPLPPRRIFLIRALGIAAAAVLLPAYLVLPFAHLGVFTGHPGLLALYPMLMVLGLVSAAFGILLTLSLVRMFGARRARTIAQIIGALMGAALFLASQLPQLLSGNTRMHLLGWFMGQTAPGGWLAADSGLWWPIRAASGETLPLLLLVAGSLLLFALVVHRTHGVFVSGIMEAATSPPRAAPAAAAGLRGFRQGWMRLLLLKEWKLILRDPHLISQTLLQLLYMCPLLVLGMRGERTAWLLIPGLVFVAAMLAGNLAWLTVAAEDAPDLLGSSPHPRYQLLLVKAFAAVLPVLLLVLPLVIWWLPDETRSALALLTGLIGGTASLALAQVWWPRRGNRADLRSRYQQDRLANVLELFCVLGWGGISACIVQQWWGWLSWLLLPALALPLIAWLAGFKPRRELGG